MQKYYVEAYFQNKMKVRAVRYFTVEAASHKQAKTLAELQVSERPLLDLKIQSQTDLDEIHKYE